MRQSQVLKTNIHISLNYYYKNACQFCIYINFEIDMYKSRKLSLAYVRVAFVLSNVYKHIL